MRRRSNGWIFARGPDGRSYRADVKPPSGSTWYVAYFANGKKIREGVGPKKSDAAAKLKERLNEVDAGSWNLSKPLSFDDLLELVRADWRNRGRKSRLTTPSGLEESGIRRLREAFGSAEIARIKASHLDAYSNRRQEKDHAAVSTVRNELNVLKRGMRLAHRQGQLAAVPPFPTLTPKTVRTGFFERSELDLILSELPAQVRPAVLFMYWTGWRRGEVLSREWRHVDLKAGVIRLEPGETKNGKGRDFPYRIVPELDALIEQQRAHTDAASKKIGQVVPWLFHRDGRRLLSFRSAWRAACKRVGVAVQAKREGTTPRALWNQLSKEERRSFRGLQRIPHDFRRTAVRNLIRAGVSQKVAMELTGHLTPSVFDRYNITDDRDRRDAVAKLAAAAQDRQVLPLRKEAKG